MSQKHIQKIHQMAIKSHPLNMLMFHMRWKTSKTNFYGELACDFFNRVTSVTEESPSKYKRSQNYD